MRRAAGFDMRVLYNNIAGGGRRSATTPWFIWISKTLLREFGLRESALQPHRTMTYHLIGDDQLRLDEAERGLGERLVSATSVVDPKALYRALREWPE